MVFYARSKDGTMEPVKVNKTHVGRMVLTKAPGSMTRRDITDQYKFPEGKWMYHQSNSQSASQNKMYIEFEWVTSSFVSHIVHQHQVVNLG